LYRFSCKRHLLYVLLHDSRVFTMMMTIINFLLMCCIVLSTLWLFFLLR